MLPVGSTAAASQLSVPCGADGISEAGSDRQSHVSLGASSSASGALGLLSTATIAQPARIAPQGFFNCSKCRKMLGLGDQSTRPGICAKDYNSYKGLAQRWTRQRALKTWWDKLSDDEKTAWYQKQHVLPSGSKRKYDNINYADVAEESVGHQERDADAFLTWTWFKRYGLMEGKSVPELEREWAVCTTAADTEAIFRRGQWLVPEYAGVRREAVVETKQISQSSRSAHVETSEQLAQLQQSGQSLLKQFETNIRGAIMPAPSDLPATDATVADQPHSVLPPNVISQQIHREVLGTRLAFNTSYTNTRTHTYA
jgi:hypothetical protein